MEYLYTSLPINAKLLTMEFQKSMNHEDGSRGDANFPIEKEK